MKTYIGFFAGLEIVRCENCKPKKNDRILFFSTHPHDLRPCGNCGAESDNKEKIFR